MQLVLPDGKANYSEQPAASFPIWKVLKRRRKAISVTFIIFALMASIVTFVLPPIFRSSATILIEQQEIPQDLVRSTVTSIADQRIELISQRVMNTSNLWEVIKKYDLYKERMQSEPREVIVERMRSDISRQMISADVMDPKSGRPAKATLAFKISYDNRSPELAYKVANELTSLYLDENLKNRENLAGQASSFLEDEADRIKGNIVDIEARISKFKQENEGKLPDMLQYNLQAAERSEREQDEIDRQISLLNNRITLLRGQLAQLSPQNVLMTDSGERVLSPEGRLKYLESQYASLVASYSQNHPDVVRTKRELDALRSQVGEVDLSDSLAQKRVGLEAELSATQKKYSDDHPDVKRLRQEISKLDSEIVKTGADNRARAQVKADNPTWIQLNTELTSAIDELKTFRAKKDDLKNQVNLYRERLASSPEVEKAYRGLMLDYDNAMHKYQETRNKQMEAKLAQSLETERKGERFTLVEPPMLPEAPVKPNKIAVFLLGMLVACAAAFGAGAAAEKMDESFRGRESVTRALGVTPLVTVPYIEVAQEKNLVNQRIKIAFAGVALSLICGIVAVHFLYKPIDVLWFVSLRKIGL